MELNVSFLDQLLVYLNGPTNTDLRYCSNTTMNDPFYIEEHKDTCKGVFVFILGTSGIQRLIVCEWEDASLSCKDHADNKVIHVLSGVYGRKENKHPCVCPKYLNCNTKCEKQDSLRTVKDRCEGKTYCQFKVDNDFFGGDPCSRTRKYLNLTYQCNFKQGMYW